LSSLKEFKKPATIDSGKKFCCGWVTFQEIGN